MVSYYKGLLRGITSHYKQSLETPYKDLPKISKKNLLWGSGAEEIEFTFWRAGKSSKTSRPFEGVIPNLQRLYQESESEFTRNRLKAFMSPRFCDACNGKGSSPNPGRPAGDFPETPLTDHGPRNTEHEPRTTQSQLSPTSAESSHAPRSTLTPPHAPPPSLASPSWTSALSRSARRRILREFETDGVSGKNRA